MSAFIGVVVGLLVGGPVGYMAAAVVSVARDERGDE